ncbi:MAG: hypothetical protein HQM09_22635 [Candidatus Riflebacteria bacterium]|nr:hypothetical protein [Candidatus Riflebacteria bacterium]
MNVWKHSFGLAFFLSLSISIPSFSVQNVSSGHYSSQESADKKGVASSPASPGTPSATGTLDLNALRKKAQALELAAQSALNSGSIDKAIENFRGAQEAYKTLKNQEACSRVTQFINAVTFESLAKDRFRGKDLSEVEVFYKEASSVYNSLDNKLGVMRVRSGLEQLIQKYSDQLNQEGVARVEAILAEGTLAEEHPNEGGAIIATQSSDALDPVSGKAKASRLEKDAINFLNAGNCASAANSFRESREIYKKIKDGESIARIDERIQDVALENFANTRLASQEYSAAIDLFTQLGSKMFKNTDSKGLARIQKALLTIREKCQSQSDTAGMNEAQKALKDILHNEENTPSVLSPEKKAQLQAQVNKINTSANEALQNASYSEAIKFFQNAKELYGQLDDGESRSIIDQKIEAIALENSARQHFKTKEFSEAEGYLKDAREIFTHIYDASGIARIDKAQEDIKHTISLAAKKAGSVDQSQKPLLPKTASASAEGATNKGVQGTDVGSGSSSVTATATGIGKSVAGRSSTTTTIGNSVVDRSNTGVSTGSNSVTATASAAATTIGNSVVDRSSTGISSGSRTVAGGGKGVVGSSSTGIGSGSNTVTDSGGGGGSNSVTDSGGGGSSSTTESGGSDSGKDRGDKNEPGVDSEDKKTIGEESNVTEANSSERAIDMPNETHSVSGSKTDVKEISSNTFGPNDQVSSSSAMVYQAPALETKAFFPASGNNMNRNSSSGVSTSSRQVSRSGQQLSGELSKPTLIPAQSVSSVIATGARALEAPSLSKVWAGLLGFSIPEIRVSPLFSAIRILFQGGISHVILVDKSDKSIRTRLKTNLR